MKHQDMGEFDIISPKGFIILSIVILFIVGAPLTMILKGRND